MRFVLLVVMSATLCFGAQTYYVDSSRGDDGNPGTAAGKAWKTLNPVNAREFQPGDRILFRSGGAWQGSLAPKSSGAEGAPIVIDRYGEGPRPKIDGAGEVEDAVRLYNVQHIEVRNLEVTNQGAERARRRGVHILLDNFGTAKHIVVSGLYVHDVNGSNGNRDGRDKDNGGIIFRTRGEKTPSRYDGLIIERNLILRVDRSAIAAASFHARRSQWFPSLNVVIRDNYVEDIGGDGIVPWATDGALVEHNIARHCNRRAGSYNAGIWPWSTDNTLLQLNVAAFTHTTLDGQGFDSDYNSRNTMFQYNYSHDNEGGFMLICSPVKRNVKDNIGNIGTVVRYNISRNDATRTFHLSGAEQTAVYNNAIYTAPGSDVQILAVTDWEGWPDGAVFRNNTFWSAGTATYGHQTGRNKDGTYELAAGWGPAKNIVFEGNRYIGKHVNRPEDATAEVVESAPAPPIDWNEPQFDTKNPEGFEKFMDAHREWMMRVFKEQFGSVHLGR